MITPEPNPYKMYIRNYPVQNGQVTYTNHNITYTITTDSNGNLTIESTKAIVINLLSDRKITIDHQL